MSHFFKIIQDIFVSNVFYVIPSIAQWYYHLKIKKDIIPIPLKNSIGKKATLYQHGKWMPDYEGKAAVLLLHGMYGHPCVLMHLANEVHQISTSPVFSLLVFYNKASLTSHRMLLKKALDYIIERAKDQGFPLKGIIIAGHSMGGMEGAYRAFVDMDPRILAVISIAGVLKVVDYPEKSLEEDLKPMVNDIFAGVQANPQIPLFQIVGGSDWNAPLEATLIRKGDCSYVVKDGMHLNILFKKDFMRKFLEFLQRAIYGVNIPKC